MTEQKVLSEFEKGVLSIMQNAVTDTIKARMTEYGSPLKPIIDDAFKVHADTIRKIMYDAMGEAINDGNFKESVKQAFYHKVARGLVDGIAGSVDKAINQFKQDPTIKAKMVLAIETIISGLEKVKD